MHGNCNENTFAHHLYAIDDLQEGFEFKFGISDDPIEADGLSRRAREQQDYCNLIVGWIRFSARVIVTNIPNREEAKQIEDKYMDAFETKYGRLPRCNRRKNRK